MIFNRPATEQIVLDHTGHWLRDADKARVALTELGFVVTPFSEQHVPDASGALVSAGSGNLCVMLESGYLEFLTPLAQTPTGLELARGIERYQGVHIAAFGVADAQRWHESRSRLGFLQSDVVDLRRDIPLEEGTTQARFSVARPRPPGMPEGRFQALVHHTPEALWQPRWLGHANGARTLAGLVVMVEDLKEASKRFSNWFQTPAVATTSGTLFALHHGDVLLVDSKLRAALFGDWDAIDAPGIIAPVIDVDDPGRFATLESVGTGQSDIHWRVLPPALGGLLGVVPHGKRFADLL